MTSLTHYARQIPLVIKYRHFPLLMTELQLVVGSREQLLKKPTLMLQLAQ